MMIMTIIIIYSRVFSRDRVVEGAEDSQWFIRCGYEA